MLNKFLKTFWLNMAWIMPVALIIQFFGWHYFIALIFFGILAAIAGLFTRKLGTKWTP